MIVDIDISRLPNDAGLTPVVDWCNEHCGPLGKMWQGYYDETDHVFRFHFQRKADAVLFTLRWA